MSHSNWMTSSSSSKILVFEFPVPILLAEGVCHIEYGPYLILIVILSNRVMPF